MSASHIQVSDLPSNFPEQLDYYAQHLKAPQRRKVLQEAYRGHKKPRFVSDLSENTGLSSIRVSQEAAKLEVIGLLTKGRSKNPKSGRSETYYVKRPQIAVHLPKLISLATDKKKRNLLVTKRSPRLKGSVNGSIVRVEVAKSLVKAHHITIDNIDSFKRILNTPPASSRLVGLSENAFKKGIQKIIGEKGDFKDWPGESSDLMTTRIRFRGKRVRAAFAFKGPGQPGKLTIAKMGKNGDQGPRLFEEVADIYVVQHWSEVDPMVHRFIETLAIAKSITRTNPVYYCIIDGQDSDRLVRAYRDKF